MKTLLLILTLLTVSAPAFSSEDFEIQDEALSQKYEALILDGEDKYVVEDMMADDGVLRKELDIPANHNLRDMYFKSLKHGKGDSK